MSASDLRLAILVSRFNADITERLLQGARGCLEEHGADQDGIDVYFVPGAWELPQAAARIVRNDRHDAVLTLGCVIRGETPHFDYVCDEASRGLGVVARQSPIPVVFGVLTTDTHDQALARAGEGASNKGYEVALAALQMVAFQRRLEAR
ncbi:MAG: 6,7-dimethyl-8-ribityllumazine synthase [Gemmatimonadota bacterium]